MDLKKYDDLRKKINTKDFEGKNRNLDKWLFRFSFLGNIGSIFFAYFLVYPSLLKAITLNFISGFWGSGIAFVFTLIFLVIFEIIKRYLIRNFSHDYVVADKLKPSIFGWLLISVSVVILSFYLSISGSKNLASTSIFINKTIEIDINQKRDSIIKVFDSRKATYLFDNENLRQINTDLREKLAETPLTYRTIRNEYQSNIDKNVAIVENNQNEINKITAELNDVLNELRETYLQAKTETETEDIRNIFLFVIIVVFNELLIIGGLFFREYFEYNLYLINRDIFEKVYQKKDRYKALLAFIYNKGKAGIGDRVISGLELKALVVEKTTIPNSNKFVDEFLHDMDRLNVFNTVGKRRHISSTYLDAINTVENFDDTLRILENIK